MQVSQPACRAAIAQAGACRSRTLLTQQHALPARPTAWSSSLCSPRRRSGREPLGGRHLRCCMLGPLRDAAEPPWAAGAAEPADPGTRLLLADMAYYLDAARYLRRAKHRATGPECDPKCRSCLDQTSPRTRAMLGHRRYRRARARAAAGGVDPRRYRGPAGAGPAGRPAAAQAGRRSQRPSGVQV